MQTDFLKEKIVHWQKNSPDGPIYPNIHSFILFRAKRAFREYHPAIGPFPSFERRFEEWLKNIDNDYIQQTLFQLVPKLFFIGPEEFISLYQSAMTEKIEPWLVDTHNIDIFSNDYSSVIQNVKNSTWFCPITDSLHISDFCHVNRLSGIERKPDWHSLARFGSIEKIADFINAKKITNIVLIEDFVGSGNQVTGQNRKSKMGTVSLACDLIKSRLCEITPKILIIPLVICYTGLKVLRESVKEFGDINVESMIELPQELLVTEETSNLHLDIYTVIKQLSEVYGIDFVDGPFGYDDTGALLVMYTNCPNNTISLVHENTENWQPLFPRVPRTKN